MFIDITVVGVSSDILLCKSVFYSKLNTSEIPLAKKGIFSRTKRVYSIQEYVWQDD